MPHSQPSSPAMQAMISAPFDIAAYYLQRLSSDPDLTMPVAAIEALIEVLSNSCASTISETLSLLSTSTSTLKSRIPNPISLSAGTDLFQRYLVTTLTRPGSYGSDFHALRTHLLSNSRLFVERAKDSRNRIASSARHFIRDGCTVLTNGGSRVVCALLHSAASKPVSIGTVSRFKVVHVVSSPANPAACESFKTISSLRDAGVPVAVIHDGATAYSLGKVDMVIVGAEGVLENGGIISRLGTYQIGLLAKAAGKPFYVVAESHKFVRLFPLGQFDFPIEQNVLDFRVSGDDARMKAGADHEDAVDFTPPDLISGIITENGVLTPSAVSEELIKMWF